MSVSVRPYAAADRAACARVFFRAVREGTASDYDAAQRAAWAPSPEPDGASADKLLGQWCRVAERDGEIVGFMSLDRTGYLDMAFVLPEEMGRGTAAQLYHDLLAPARAAGLGRLTVRASHLARRFFARQGWRLDASEAFAFNGQVYDVFHMSLDLTPEGTPAS